MTNQAPSLKELGESPQGKGRIAARFRNCNIALFVLATSVTVVAMLVVFYNIVGHASSSHARRYAVNSADTLSAHVNREIALMAKAANSNAVVGWLMDERDEKKKALAYEEMLGTLAEIYSNNLYATVESSRNEYRIDKDFTSTDLRPFDVLNQDDPKDAWYFWCAATEEPYLLNINIDRVLERKRVWLDYKVIREGVMLGAVSTGLEFSHVVGALFSNFDQVLHGYIVDENGLINMDSARMENNDFRRSEFAVDIEDEFTDPVLLAAVREHMGAIKGYFGEKTPEPTLVKLSPSPYSYAAIAPVAHTNWSVVILYNGSSLFNLSLFLPAFAVTLALLIMIAVASHLLSDRLIFSPLTRLIQSLARLKKDRNGHIYGIGRDDELGSLSGTILDLFTMANHDALTGLYNRRIMESELENSMKFLSRSGSTLSTLMIDVDYFKKYNDTYGHEEGDVCLKKIARALSEGITRASDFVARYGGEEFFAVLPNTDEEGARTIAEKMLENVRALALPHADSSAAPHVTVSIGVTTGTVLPSQGWEEYSKRADEALYMSKQNGRDRYTYLEMP